LEHASPPKLARKNLHVEGWIQRFRPQRSKTETLVKNIGRGGCRSRISKFIEQAQVFILIEPPSDQGFGQVWPGGRHELEGAPEHQMHREHCVVRERQQNVLGFSLSAHHDAAIQQGGKLTDGGKAHCRLLKDEGVVDRTSYDCLAQVAREYF